MKRLGILFLFSAAMTAQAQVETSVHFRVNPAFAGQVGGSNEFEAKVSASLIKSSSRVFVSPFPCAKDAATAEVPVTEVASNDPTLKAFFGESPMSDGGTGEPLGVIDKDYYFCVKHGSRVLLQVLGQGKEIRHD